MFTAAKMGRLHKAARRPRPEIHGRCQIGPCACEKFWPAHGKSGKYCKTCGHRSVDHGSV